MDEFTGKTVEEAIEEGLNALGIAREEAEITVLEEPKKKLFGATPAKVKVVAKKKLTDGERAVEFLKGLFEYLPFTAEVSLVSEDEKTVIELASDNAKRLVGHRGEIIDAIQALCGAVANTGRKEYKRVVVDCDGYRKKREETLERLAVKLAEKAVRLGKKVRLEPMNPYDRRIIHAALVDNGDVTTKSEGNEPARFVVIIPKKMKSFDRKDKFDRGDRRGRDFKRDDRHGGDRYKKYPHRDLPDEGTPETSGTSLRRSDSSVMSGYKKGGYNGFFGTFLGNSRDSEEGGDTTETETTEAETPVETLDTTPTEE